MHHVDAIYNWNDMRIQKFQNIEFEFDDFENYFMSVHQHIHIDFLKYIQIDKFNYFCLDVKILKKIKFHKFRFFKFIQIRILADVISINYEIDYQNLYVSINKWFQKNRCFENKLIEKKHFIYKKMISYKNQIKR